MQLSTFPFDESIVTLVSASRGLPAAPGGYERKTETPEPFWTLDLCPPVASCGRASTMFPVSARSAAPQGRLALGLSPATMPSHPASCSLATWALCFWNIPHLIHGWSCPLGSSARCFRCRLLGGPRYSHLVSAGAAPCPLFCSRKTHCLPDLLLRFQLCSLCLQLSRDLDFVPRMFLFASCYF